MHTSYNAYVSSKLFSNWSHKDLIELIEEDPFMAALRKAVGKNRPASVELMPTKASNAASILVKDFFDFTGP